MRLFPNVSLPVKLQLLNENLFCDLKYAPKVIEGIVYNLLQWPSSVIESIKYDNIIKSTEITKPPIFIIGFWRSGTTHLHNLMVKDPQFGFVSQFSVAYPQSFIVNSWMKNIAARFVPKTRPMDNMPLAFDLPQEEEFALCSMLPASFYHAFTYPKKAGEYFDKYAMFDGVSSEMKKEWQSYYTYFLKKTTYVNHGKQLVLKNPVNTGRVKQILEMFPEAKFIHIYRNPYEVYMSNVNFFNKFTLGPTLQDLPDSSEMEQNVIHRYKKAMERYFKDSNLIPPGNLVETRYEDLIESPKEILQNIYSRLNLQGLDDTIGNMRNYLAGLTDFKRNKHNFSPEVIERIKREFDFTIKKWGYTVP